MAVPMPAADSAGSSGLVASPLTTVLVFSQASGTKVLWIYHSLHLPRGFPKAVAVLNHTQHALGGIEASDHAKCFLDVPCSVSSSEGPPAL